LITPSALGETSPLGGVDSFSTIAALFLKLLFRIDYLSILGMLPAIFQFFFILQVAVMPNLAGLLTASIK
jgi:hypothetical protein